MRPCVYYKMKNLERASGRSEREIERESKGTSFLSLGSKAERRVFHRATRRVLSIDRMPTHCYFCRYSLVFVLPRLNL